MNPELRFKDQQGNDFPDWEEKKIKDIVELNPKSTIPDIFEYVDLESVVGVKMVSHRTLTKENAPSRAQRLAQKGDLFFQTVRPYQKNNYLFDREDNNYVFSTGYAQMRPKVDGYFLLSAIQKDSFVNLVLDRCTGTSYPSINSSNLAKIQIIVPKDREEQEKVATILRDIDQKIESQSILVEKLRNTKESMLVKMFPQEDRKVPEIRFKGFSGDWEEHNLGWLVTNNIINPPLDGNHGEKHPTSSEYVQYGIPFIMASDIKNGKVDLNDCKFITKERANKLDKGFAEEGDILLTHKATIGEVGILQGLSEDFAMITPQVTYYRIIDKNRLSQKYLYAFFNSKGFQKEIKEKATQSTRSYIGISQQRNLTLLLPTSIEEQIKIGNYFYSLDEIISINQQKYEKLCDIKKALLHKLFPTKEED